MEKYYRRTRKGRVQSLLRERYLRDDIGLGTLVGRGDLQDEATLGSMLNDEYLMKGGVRVLLVLDTNVVLKQIDVLEADDCAAFYNVVLCDTVIREVKKNDLGVYNRLVVLLRDDKKCFINFPNENHRDTWSTTYPGETSNDFNDRLIRNVAAWYAEAVESKSIAKVLFLTNDRKCREAAVKEGLASQTIHEFVRSLNGDFPGLADKVAEAQAVELETPAATKSKFTAHLSTIEINRRLQVGTAIQGTFRQNSYNRNEGSIMIYDTSGSGRKVVIRGQQYVNRAIDGDRIAVELVSTVEPGETDDGLLAEPAVDPAHSNLQGTQVVDESIKTSYGKVVGIINRNWRQYCGSVDEASLHSKSEYVLVIPVDSKLPKIRIRTRQLDSIKDQRIVVGIDSWDQFSNYPNGHLVKVIGPIGDKDTETKVLLHEFDIPTRAFSKKVMECLPEAGKEWAVTEENSKGRIDLRHLSVCSIDPPGCKDIDDALHFVQLENGNYEIGVHIADVTHFVRHGSAIDEEARTRGTSTYLVERRLDMLPGLLTTDICSLRGGVDRFAFSVVWEFTPIIEDTEHVSKKPKKDKLPLKGLEQVGVRFHKSVICSKAAMSYGEAQAWLEDPSEQSELAQGVRMLNKVAKVLRQRRNDNGALVLASPEVRFKIDQESHDPTDVEMYEQKDANALVEEFMLLANITVGRRILEKFPRCSMLRRHPAPSKDMFTELIQATKVAGVDLKVDTSKQLQESLDNAVNNKIPYFNKLLRILTTRCMMQAVYFSSGELPVAEYGHYGLASDIYTHFTSPIRRYADVVVHRLLAAVEGIDPLPIDYEKKEDMKAISDNLNTRHHNAQLAGRASISLHTVVFFRNKPIETTALVSRVRERGVVVMVPEYGIEGKVNFTKTDEEAETLFKYDDKLMKLTHKASGKSVSIFQQVKVKIHVNTGVGHRETLVVSIIEPDFSEN